MTEHIRRMALQRLSKTAQQTQATPTAAAPGKAFKDLTPAEQAQRRAAYQQKRLQNGRNMAADTGTPSPAGGNASSGGNAAAGGNANPSSPGKLVDLASRAWTAPVRYGVVAPVSWLTAMGSGLLAGNGFNDSLTTANQATREAIEDSHDNLVSGAKSMATGLADGALSAPGFFTGLGMGALSFQKNLLQGKGLKGAFQQAMQTGGAASDWVNNLGIGGYSLRNAQLAVQDYQNKNTQAYMQHNGMDPNNLNVWEKGGLLGMSTANAAGRMIGETYGPGAFLGAAKGVRGVAGAIKSPIKTMSALPGNMRTAAGRAWNFAKHPFSKGPTSWGTRLGAGLSGLDTYNQYKDSQELEKFWKDNQNYTSAVPVNSYGGANGYAGYGGYGGYGGYSGYNDPNASIGSVGSFA